MQDISLPSSKADYTNNMPLIARGIGSGDLVTCVEHGAEDPDIPCPCCGELVTTTNACSPDVFVEGVGVVRLTDVMTAHKRNYPELPDLSDLCLLHSPPCNSASPNVFANGLPVARKTDTYWDVNNHIISTVTQQSVFANGE